MLNTEWQCKNFSTLTALELYEILKLRNRVFVVEQQCVYADTDEKDLVSGHLCGWHNNQLIAYARIIPPGVAFAEASIGRVVTAPEYRRTGLGKELMLRSINAVRENHKVSTIKIGAQLYLEKFYGDLGFQPCSEHYLEDGIPHIEMLLSV
ncbi:MAG: GNAT family N-acetyltransferase [Bacteroidetes bacterium]|nr:GNAT family N-acetyltransferase [Bacteroidota bacterium]